jgi:ribonuclease P protein component
MTRTEDFQRVRRNGKSHAHPLLVLISAPNQMEITRFGIVAGKVVGGAVERNRVKRWLRAAVDPVLPAIVPGKDVILIARQPAAKSDFHQVNAALGSLLARAHLIQEVGVGA